MRLSDQHLPQNLREYPFRNRCETFS